MRRGGLLPLFLTFALGFCLRQSGAAEVKDDRYSLLPPIPATVNGEKITSAMLIEEVESEFPQESALPDREVLGQQLEKALSNRINAMLLRQFFDRENIHITERDLAEYRNSLSPAAKTALEQNLPRTNAAAALAIRSEKYLRQTAPEQIAVSDGEVESYYRRNQLKFKQRAQTTYSLVTMDRNIPGAEEKLRAIREKIAGGASFQEYASVLAPLPEDAATAAAVAAGMKEQELSPVIAGKGAFMLVRTDKHTPPEFIPLAGVSDSIRRYLAAKKLSLQLSRLLTRLTAEASIERKSVSGVTP